MTMLFEDICILLKKTEKQVFEDAWKHRYGSNREVVRDLLQYQVAGILPAYVQEYLDYVYHL